MTGLDKMKSQILEQARAAAGAKRKEAGAQAEEILAQAREEAAKLSESISRKSEAEIANYKERAASSIDLRRRSRVLEAKQQLIAEALDKAYQSLTGMGQEEYFAMLKRLFEKYVLPQDGEIYFSAADLERMPSGFEAEIKQIARAKGGSLILSEKGRNIDGGFVLAYGGIEENCTLKAMLEAKKDELSDKVRELLFA